MLKKIFYSIFLIWAFFYTYITIQPELHLHMQQAPFFHDKHFFHYYLEKVGGIGMYISNYIIQLFHSNLYGSLTILIIAVGLALLLYAILRKLIAGNGTLILYLPVAVVISLFHDYYFPFDVLIQTLFIVLATYLYIQFISAKSYLWITGFVFYAFFYYVFGSGSALVFGVSALLSNYFYSSTKGFIIKLTAGLLLLTVFPYIAYRFIFNLSLSQAYFQFLPNVPVTLTYSKSVILYLLLFLTPLVLLLSIPFSKIKLPTSINDSRRKKIVQIATNLSFGIVFIGMIYFTDNKHARNIAQIDYYAYQKNWEKVIELSKSDKEYDFLINLDYNRAIDHSNKFLDLFFDYPQLLGKTSLFPDNLHTAMYGIQISDYYFDINYISKAQHMAYGAIVLEPYNPRVLKKLVLTNLTLGNYNAAKTFLDLLSKNSLSKEFVEKYYPYTQDTSKVMKDPTLARKRELQPGTFAIPGQITDRLIDVIAKDSTNKQAFEHLQMCYLLDHNLGAFMKNFGASMKFYKKIPNIYEQALLVYIYSTKTRSELLGAISKETKQQFLFFMKTLKEHNNNLQAARSSLSDVENSYMYYIKYLSPLVTNLKAKTTK